VHYTDQIPFYHWNWETCFEGVDECTILPQITTEFNEVSRYVAVQGTSFYFEQVFRL